MNEKRYLLNINLDEIEPEIWRRFVVPADITLDRLHDVIQVPRRKISHRSQQRTGNSAALNDQEVI